MSWVLDENGEGERWMKEWEEERSSWEEGGLSEEDKKRRKEGEEKEGWRG